MHHLVGAAIIRSGRDFRENDHGVSSGIRPPEEGAREGGTNGPSVGVGGLSHGGGFVARSFRRDDFE